METLDIGHNWGSDYPQSAAGSPIGFGCERPDGAAGRLRRHSTEQSLRYRRGFRLGSTANWCSQEINSGARASERMMNSGSGLAGLFRRLGLGSRRFLWGKSSAGIVVVIQAGDQF